jgi:Glycosyl hydrolase family 76
MDIPTSRSSTVTPPATVRRWPLLLTALFAFSLSAVSLAAFAAGSVGDGVIGNAGAARSCAHIHSRVRARKPAAHQSKVEAGTSRLRRDHAGCGGAQRLRTGSPPEISVAARRGVAELIGGGRDQSPVAWAVKQGLWWSKNSPAHWWQSALALRTLVRYLERTGNTNPAYQQVILATYERNVRTPHADATTNFVNKFLDDTAWWGLAWLEAAKYELRYRHDLSDTGTFLRLAEWDAEAVADGPKRCGGVEWKLGYPPDTIASVEYVALAAGLYDFQNLAGPFADVPMASHWLSQARSTLNWLVDSRLVNMSKGTVADKLDGACNKLLGAPMTYTEGEVAEALTQLGAALHDRSYFKQAARFLRYVTSRWSGMISAGVLQEPCESSRSACGTNRTPLNLPAYKGIFVNLLTDPWVVSPAGEGWAEACEGEHRECDDGFG